MTDDMFDHIEDMDLKKILGEKPDISKGTSGIRKVSLKSADSKPSAIWVKDLKMGGVKDE